MSIAIREALAPVIDWYQSDEHPGRNTVDIVKDVVADLQDDRKAALKLKSVEAERDLYREYYEANQERIAAIMDGTNEGRIMLAVSRYTAAHHALKDATKHGF